MTDWWTFWVVAGCEVIAVSALICMSVAAIARKIRHKKFPR